MRLNPWSVGYLLACLATALFWPCSALANPFEVLLLNDGFPEAAVRLHEPHAGIEGFRIRVAAHPDDAPGEWPMSVVRYPPSFPHAAAVRNVQGWALLEFTVNASGRVEGVRVVEEPSQGEGFGAAAIASAEQYLYLLRHVDGAFLPTPVRALPRLPP